MLLHKSVVHDTRVRREAGALADAGHEVTVVHLPLPGEPPPSGLAFRTVAATLPAARRRLGRRARLGLEALSLSRRAAAERPDAVHAHDAAMLLPGLLAKRRCGARLVYDSHELATGVPYRDRAWSVAVATTERLGAPRADATIAVSDGIAARLSARYRLSRAPVVVRNLPDLPPPDPGRAPDLRRELGVGAAPLLLHQGSAAPGRGCETLVATLALLPEAHLLLLGATSSDRERLLAVAGRVGAGQRVHVLDPVAPEALLSYTAQADVGVSLLEDNCENHRLALPNKLFEYLAAGLPVVVADLPEAARLVAERGVGRAADPADPESVAAAVRAALSERDDAGLRRRLAEASAELSWQRERERLLAVYEGLGGG